MNQPTASDQPLPSAWKRMRTAEHILWPMQLPEFASSTVIPAAFGVIVAAGGTTDIAVIFGAACIGSGLAGAFGMYLSQIVSEMHIPGFSGRKRLLANWLCGLMTIPFASRVHKYWFPEDDIVLVSATLAGVASLFGLIAFAWWLGPLLRRFRARGNDFIDSELPEGQKYPAKQSEPTTPP